MTEMTSPSPPFSPGVGQAEGETGLVFQMGLRITVIVMLRASLVT